MRCGRWMAGLVATGWVLATCGGCVSMNDYRKVRAQNRTLAADKEALEKELFDLRNGSGSLRTRLTSLEGELSAKDQLIENLRGENELLDEMRRLSQAELEEMAGKQAFSDVVIAGPKLPQQLDSALKRFADEHPSAVTYDSARGIVKWKADLLFALGSDVVKDSSMEALQRFTEIVKSPSAKDFEVIVVGHTDDRPIAKAETKSKHPTNWHLSAHRSISVSNVLLKNGYSPARVGVMGCGEYRPIADNSAETGRSQNRRVEIYLVPSGSIVRTALGWRVDGTALAFASVGR